MHIHLSNGQPVGRIEDPFKCCIIDQKIYDANNAERFTVTGSICQQGACCPCCADFSFDVLDASSMSVSKIVKPSLTLAEACAKTNRFVVEFPEQCSMNDKHLLVGAAMLLDLQYFEVNKNSN